MARIPKRLCHTPVDSTVETVYTVPAATKTIIRHIHVSNPSGSIATLTLSIGADAAATRFYDGFRIPAAGAGVTGSVVDWYGYYVLEAAEIVQADSDTDDILILTMNGDEIVLG